MRQIISHYNRPILAIAITIISILLTQLIILTGYTLFDIEIRHSEIVIGTIAPLIIAPSVTWYLFGMLKKLDALEREMRKMATYDQLTNALTRTALVDKARTLINLAERESQQVSVLMIDLDHFKHINDRYGHAAGDFVLKMFGEMINKHKRKSDLFGRLGGEEFVLILWGAGTQDAVKLSNTLHHRLAQSKFEYNGQLIACTMSIGIAHDLCNRNKIELNELLERADDALYKAKKTGRNKSVLHSDITAD